MKRAISILLAMILALTLVACGSTPSAPESSGNQAPAESAPTDQVYEIRAAYDYLEDSYMGQNFQKFVDRAEELGEGRIKFTLYPSGSLYTADQALEAVQAGNLEICSVANSNIGNYSSKALVISLPFMIPNRESMDEMWDLDGELMKQAYADLPSMNFKVLGIFAFVVTDISSSYPLHVPSDMTGHLVRAYGQTNSNYTELSGGAPVFMSGGEVVQALSTGTIDSAWCGVESMVTRKYYEFQDYICAVGAERSDFPVVCCNSWWESLPADIQGILQQAFDDIIDEERDGSYQVGEDARKELAAQGCEVYYPTEEEMTEWYAVADEVYKSFYDSIGEDLINLAVSIRNKYV